MDLMQLLSLRPTLFKVNPDRGSNFSMLGKNKSSPESFIKTLEFAKIK